MKIIRSSNLTLRFYKKDGWTLESIREYFPKGEIKFPFPKDNNPYYIIDKYKEFFVDKVKLLKECYIEPYVFWTEIEKARTQEQILDSYLGF